MGMSLNQPAALKGKNLIINGGMQFSQRGDYTSATSISDGTYYLDRWEVDIATVTGTVQDISNGYLSKLNTQKIVSTSTATGRLVSIQKIEVSGGVLGAELTASAQVKSNSTDARLFLVDNTNGAVLDVVAHTGGGAFEKLTISGTAPTSCTDLRVYLALRSSSQGNVAITSGDYIEFTQVQLELGSVATAFEHRSYGEELALCQRYFQELTNGVSSCPLANLAHYNGTTAYGVISLPVEMRAAPSVTIPDETLFKTYAYGGSEVTISLIVAGNSSRKQIEIKATTSSRTSGHAAWMRTGDVAASIQLSSEL
jgi:hypothetical protein